MDVYKTREFARDARRLGVRDPDLIEAVRRAERGLIDADIGANLIKQRLAREGQGRSGGYRTVLFHRVAERAVFLLIFAKNRKTNLSGKEDEAFRIIARKLATLSEPALGQLLQAGTLIEIPYDPETKKLPQ